MTSLDLRLNACRPDLADARLKGKTDSRTFVIGRPAWVKVAVLDLKSAPTENAGLQTQMLMGDAVLIFDEIEGFSWVQAKRDGYVGYVASCGLAEHVAPPTHVVTVSRTFAYQGPDMKKPVTACLSMGNQLHIGKMASTRGTDYAVLDNGEALIASHIQPIGQYSNEFVAIAEQLEHAPYLWGGASGFGVDCSGLVQLAMMMAGRSVLRDTDMQAATLGSILNIGDSLAGLQRGDLVFWKGHVAIMLDTQNIIHASGNTMLVSREPLRQAVERIAHLYGHPIGFRRP